MTALSELSSRTASTFSAPTFTLSETSKPNGKPPAQVLAQVFSVEPHVGDVHGALEVDEDPPAPALGAEREALPVPADALPLVRVAPRFPGDQALDAGGVGEHGGRPSGVVEGRSLRPGDVAQHELPARIEIQSE